MEPLNLPARSPVAAKPAVVHSGLDARGLHEFFHAGGWELSRKYSFRRLPSDSAIGSAFGMLYV